MRILDSLLPPGGQGLGGFLIGIVGIFGLVVVMASSMPLPPRTIDLPPGQKLVSAQIINEGHGEVYRTRPMQPGEKPEDHTLTYSRPDEQRPRAVVTIREHAAEVSVSGAVPHKAASPPAAARASA